MNDFNNTDELYENEINGGDVPTDDTQTEGCENGSVKDKKKAKKDSKELEEARSEIDKLNLQIEELNDKYLRVIAEYDNYRRRTSKEKEGLYSDTVCDVIKTLLPIADDLERAAGFDKNAENADGITMILKKLLELLASLGVTEIEALNKTFDPNYHNAIMHIEDEKYGENEIYCVVQKGYIRGDKVIRHAMVMVAN